MTIFPSLLLLALSPTMASALPPQISERDRDVPFVPTPPSAVEAMLDLAEVKAGDSLIDLGSGDGRIVIAAAARGAVALGIEIDPDLVRRARSRARDAGVEDRVRFRGQDLFETPIRGASVVTLYLLPEINLRLRPRLLTELAPGTRVVSHAFRMGDWAADEHRVVEGRNVYLWVVPAVVGGAWTFILADGTRQSFIIEQRFQEASGTLDGTPIGDVALRGTRLRFSAGGRQFHGIVGEGTISPDPAVPGSVQGWSAVRP